MATFLGFQIALILFLVAGASAYYDFSTYPTNFDEMKKHFKIDRPTIGVLTMANEDKRLFEGQEGTDNTSYVAASYVKLIEAGGARAVPLICDMPETELKTIIESINGVILSGGDGDMANSHYEIVTRMVYAYSQKKLDEEGEIWPIFGICRGSQIIPVVTDKKDFLVHTDSKNFSVPLQFVDGYKKSRMFGKAPRGVIDILKKKPITINAHLYSLPSHYFLNNEVLNDFFRVISLNVDRDGIEFVSTYEGRKYPMYGLQWHPEKLLFVWNPMMVADHSIDSIRVAQYVANFMVMEARRNSNRFATRELEEKYSIYRWNPVYIGTVRATPYEQVYVFPRRRLEL